MYEKRRAIAKREKDLKQLLGLGQFQNASYEAGIILRFERPSTRGQRRCERAASYSTAAAQPPASGSHLRRPNELAVGEAPWRSSSCRTGAIARRLKRAKISQRK
jgi:hypothetical protein